MKSAEEYILRQSPEFKEIIYYVISVIEQEMSDIEMFFKWGIPYFYYYKKPFIYIAPNKKQNFVDIGFARGYALKLHQDILIGEKRNTIKSLRYFKIDSVDDNVLREVIVEAKVLYKKT